MPGNLHIVEIQSTYAMTIQVHSDTVEINSRTLSVFQSLHGM